MGYAQASETASSQVERAAARQVEHACLAFVAGGAARALGVAIGAPRVDAALKRSRSILIAGLGVRLAREVLFPRRSSAVQGRPIKTLEGLGTLDKPGRMQRAFIEEQAAQCGFCIPGMIMRAQALLERNPSPTQAEIRSHMSTNLCRCGTHMRILRAVERAARER